LDWFLFDLRQGFCNYYASSEVILLRSLGIPARLAVGYAEGERQPRSNTYLVRQRDAHAWPEVYFPGIGWIEFEPTASQDPLSRPPGESESGTGSSYPLGGVVEERDRLEGRLEELLAMEEDLDTEPVSPIATAPSGVPIVLLWAVIFAIGLVLIILVWRDRRQRGMPPLPVVLEAGLRRFDVQPPVALRRWTLRSTLSPLARAYMELNQALVHLGASPDSADTPAERAAALTRLLPEAAAPAQRLLAEYHAAVYGLHSGNLYVAQRAGRTIRALSWQTIIKERTGSVLRPLQSFVRRLTGSYYNVR
jgi:hypothetical protein